MKITKRQLRRIIREERRHVITENFDLARDDLSQAKRAILNQDKYFSDLAAEIRDSGDDWLTEETMTIVEQLRRASDLLDEAMANITTVQKNYSGSSEGTETITTLR